VVYASSSSALATGSALTFNGTTLGVRATSLTPSSSASSVFIEDKTTWSQGLQFYLNDAGTYFSSRPSGALGAANSGGLILSAGALVTNDPDSSNGFTATSSAASVYRPISGTHVWYANTGLTAGNTFTATEQMRLTSTGLGIGTSSPGVKLDVVGGARFSGVSGTGTQGLRLYGTGTAYNYLNIDNTGANLTLGIESSAGGALSTGSSAYASVLQSYANYSLQFGTNNIIRATIDTAGNVGIGTSSPSQKLEVAGTIKSTATGASFLASGTTAAARYAQIVNDGSVNGVLFGTEGTTAGGILTGTSSYSGIISQTANLDLALGTNGTARLIINGAGRIKMYSTISVGSATPATTGSGITFPATQSASSDANTLDDYEEGTWNPTVAGSSTAGTVAYTYRYGYYTKIGRLVYVYFDVEVSSFSGGAGGLSIGSFPFPCANIPYFYPIFQPFNLAAAYASTYTIPTGFINPNNSTMNLYSTDAGYTNFATMNVNQIGRISGYIVMQTD
jgi:hypothetical protein